MPRPRAVELHAHCYKRSSDPLDATASRRGASRLLLQEEPSHALGATALRRGASRLLLQEEPSHPLDATASRRGASRSPLQEEPSNFSMPRPRAVELHAYCYKKNLPTSRCHGLAPWSFTLT